MSENLFRIWAAHGTVDVRADSETGEGVARFIGEGGYCPLVDWSTLGPRGRIEAFSKALTWALDQGLRPHLALVHPKDLKELLGEAEGCLFRLLVHPAALGEE